MPFIAVLVLVLIALLIVPRIRVRGGVNGSTFGWMSEQWLAEYRASNPL